MEDRMKQWLRSWLQVVSLEEYQKDQVTQIKTEEERIKKLIDCLAMSANLLQKVVTDQKLDRTRFETILQHGCFDCFSVKGELHKASCKYKDHVVDKGGHNV